MNGLLTFAVPERLDKVFVIAFFPSESQWIDRLETEWRGKQIQQRPLLVLLFTVTAHTHYFVLPERAAKS